jgi:hypothetical protein
VDEAGFNLAKTRGCGRNIIGHRGGNITICAVSQNGILHHHAILGPYNTAPILDTLHNRLIPNDQGPEQPGYVIIWDNISFHRAAIGSQVTHFSSPPYSPFLNPIE